MPFAPTGKGRAITMKPRKKHPLQWRALAKNFGLPSPSAGWVTKVKIPMSDGASLGADLYEPSVPSKGVLLGTSNPFGRQDPLLTGAWVLLAGQGYTVLLVSTRGTADSDGTLDPMRDEVRDSRDVLAWVRAQPWYPGRFAAIGNSYEGYAGWALQESGPPDLATSIVMMAPHDFSQHLWGSGTMSTHLFGWAEAVTQLNLDSLTAILKLRWAAKRNRKMLAAAPVLPAVEKRFRKKAPWLKERLLRPDLADPFWEPMQHGAVLDSTRVPTFLIAGWQNEFLAQSMEQYTRLARRNVEVALLVGAWGYEGGRIHKVVTKQILEWLAVHLSGERQEFSAPIVQIQDGAVGTWHDFSSWPPAHVGTRTLYPRPDASLTEAGPEPNHTDVSFVFDPADPTPALGGHRQRGGYTDDSALAARTDTLHFDSEPLAGDLFILGSPVVNLEHSVELPDADVFVRLSDVDPTGQSRNITEAYTRTTGGALELTLLDTAYTLRAGHRLRLLIAGGSFPAYLPNPGTGENPVTAAVRKPNRHRIALSVRTHVILPHLAEQS